MSRVAIVAHPGRSVEVAEMAAQAVEWLRQAGHEVVLPSPSAEVADLRHLAAPESDLFDDTVLALSFGGDGTMLRTVNIMADHDIPVIGVNLGHLGYLTQVEPDALTWALERFFEGDYTVEERMRVRMSGSSNGDLEPRMALNDIVLERTPGESTVNIGVSLDGSYFTNYPADGVIVATPTGSTAYNFSVRGPIVDPRHRAMLLTPVSPHILFDRCLVLDPDTVLRLEVIGRVDATLSADGERIAKLSRGQWVECTAAEFPARMVTFEGQKFHEVLKAKFGLSDRPEQR